MAKIGNFSHKLTADNIDHTIWYTVMYTLKTNFYIAIPSDYRDSFDLLGNDVKKKYGASLMDSSFKNPIVSNTTLEGAKENFVSLLRLLIESTTSSREVIVVGFKSEKSDSLVRKEKFPNLGFSLHFVYCTEKKAGGSPPKYYIFTKRQWNGEDHITREEVSVSESYYHGKDIVIADTPENRIFLETVYKALGELHDKMQSLTSDPENLLAFISSKQLLLK